MKGENIVNFIQAQWIGQMGNTEKVVTFRQTNRLGWGNARGVAEQDRGGKMALKKIWEGWGWEYGGFTANADAWRRCLRSKPIEGCGVRRRRSVSPEEV